MSSTPKPSVPSASSPSADRQIAIHRVAIFGYDGDGETFETMEEPSFVQTLASTGALPDWLFFETVIGEKVMIREDTVKRMAVCREVWVDLDTPLAEPPRSPVRRGRKTPASSEAVD